MKYQNSHIKGWLRVIIAFIGYIFVSVSLHPFITRLSGIEPYVSMSERTDLQKVILLISDTLIVFTVLWVLLKFIDLESFTEIGLKIKNRTSDVFYGLLTGLVIMGLGYSLLFTLDEISFSNFNFNLKDFILLGIIHTLVAVKEEVLLRGYILKNLNYSFGKIAALISSAILFSLLHGFNPNFNFMAFVNLFLAGVMLGLPYLYSKNLMFPIALHFSWNFFQSLFGFNVSGIDSYSLIEFNISDANKLNGGSFGFEGSILSIIVQILMIVLLYKYYTNNQQTKLSQKLS